MAKKKKVQLPKVDPQTIEFLKQIAQAFGPSSFESDVRTLFANEVKGYADDVSTCGLGSIIARKTGTSESPRVMIAGHIDEIGFMVNDVTKDGFIKFNPIGGWWGHVILGQKVIIRTRNGKDIIGVIGAKAPHILTPEERDKVLKPENMFIDVGSYEDYNAVKKLGIQPGDPIVPYSEFHILGDGRLLMAKAWDDRIGTAVAIEVLRSLKGVKHPNTVFAVGTTQEEVGLRGAGSSAYEVNPDVGFAVDVTIAEDTPASTGGEYSQKCGKGPSISVMDGSLMPNPKLRNFVIEVAEKEKIPFQLGALARGGTDGGRIAMTRSGVPTLTISVPSRYIHSANSIIQVDDYLNTVKLLVAVLKRLDEKIAKSFRT